MNFTRTITAACLAITLVCAAVPIAQANSLGHDAGAQAGLVRLAPVGGQDPDSYGTGRAT